MDGGKSVSRAVHRLVLETFVGPCPKGHQAGHKNGIRHDNRLCNLRWVTPQQNADERNVHGTTSRGEKVAQSKLNNEKVLKIHELAALGVLREDLAKQFGVHLANINAIVLRKAWKHLDASVDSLLEKIKNEPPFEKLKRRTSSQVGRYLFMRRITPEQVLAMLECLEAAQSMRASWIKSDTSPFTSMSDYDTKRAALEEMIGGLG
jgi:hypothetical protein